MKIAKFNSLEAAGQKRDQYNIWATPVGYPLINLVDIYQHTTLPIWWFNYTGCIENGGLGRDLIIADEPNLDIEEFTDYQALVDAGYLPQPSPVL